VFFSLQKNFSCYETQQLILGTGTAIWWLTEPHLEQGLSLPALVKNRRSHVADGRRRG
jgi:hypothetical protein